MALMQAGRLGRSCLRTRMDFYVAARPARPLAGTDAEQLALFVTPLAHWDLRQPLPIKPARLPGGDDFDAKFRETERRFKLSVDYRTLAQLLVIALGGMAGLHLSPCAWSAVGGWCHTPPLRLRYALDELLFHQPLFKAGQQPSSQLLFATWAAPRFLTRCRVGLNTRHHRWWP